MKFIPMNKCLLVEMIENQSSHYIPEHFRDTISPFTVVKVVDIAMDCSQIPLNGEIGNLKIVVHTNGLEKVKMLSEEFLIVSEKFVVGIIED